MRLHAVGGVTRCGCICIALLPALRRGTQGRAGDVRAFHTREIRLSTRKPRPVNTDGELTTHTPAHFKVFPQILRVLAPEPVRGPSPFDLTTLGSRLFPTSEAPSL